MRLFFLSLALLASASAASARERAYVVCDNGLRCIMAPCPSTSALDVRSRRVRQGVWVDVAGLTRKERAEIERYNALYEGTLVLMAELEDRTVDVLGKPRVLPYLVASEIARKSTPRERRMCKRR